MRTQGDKYDKAAIIGRAAVELVEGLGDKEKDAATKVLTMIAMLCSEIDRLKYDAAYHTGV